MFLLNGDNSFNDIHTLIFFSSVEANGSRKNQTHDINGSEGRNINGPISIGNRQNAGASSASLALNIDELIENIEVKQENPLELDEVMEMHDVTADSVNR